MKTKFLIGLCVGLALVSSFTTPASAKEVKKIITRTFPISTQSIVEINNTFGNIVIAEGERSLVDFKIEITGTGLDQATAQRMVDRASVDFEQNGNRITARTTIANTNENCSNCKVTINYLVLVPSSSVHLDLTNKFGNIDIKTTPKLNFTTNLQFGNLTAGNLQGSNNNITVKFGNCTLGEAPALTATCGYGKVNINQIGTADLNISFGSLTATSIDNLTLQTKYSGITVTNLNNLKGSSSFSKLKIANLAKQCDLNSAQYGSINIDKCSPKLEQIRIGASFCNVTIGMLSQISAQATLYNRFGNINLSGLQTSPNAVNNDRDKFTKSFNGTIGSKSSHFATINISNSYANITLEP